MSNGITHRPLTGIILAGGESSRMGTDKGWMLFRGRPLIHYALELLEPLCDHLLISANDPQYERLGYTVVKDEVPGAGPLAGLCASLKHSPARDNLVIPCDMPLLSHEMLNYLLCSVRDQKAVIPVHPDGRAEPLCGYYSQEIIPRMEENLAAGRYKLTDLLSDTGAFFLKMDKTLPFYDPKIFTNLNTPAELKKVER